jgi:hypothetical protein
MHRIFRRLNPVLAAVVIAASLTPAAVNAQGGEWVRGYFDFFDNLCYPCTGQMETNPFCTCTVWRGDAFAASAARI